MLDYTRCMVFLLYIYQIVLFVCICFYMTSFLRLSYFIETRGTRKDIAICQKMVNDDKHNNENATRAFKVVLYSEGRKSDDSFHYWCWPFR